MFKTKNYRACLSCISSNSSTEFDIPIVCPNCNCSLQPTIQDNYSLKFDKDRLLIISFIGNCCNVPFYATYRYSNYKATLLDVYPHLKPATLPNTIKELSPRFTNLYEQSYTAEQNGHIELAGSGYRNSIEILIKDFAIIKLKADKDTVCKMSLYEVIGEYLKEVNIETSAADVIRVLGNDYTHYQRKYDDIDFIVVKKYLEIFIHQIDAKLLLMEPIVPVNRRKIMYHSLLTTFR